MSETPHTTGQFDPTQATVPPEAQRIYDVAADYKGAVELAYGSDIAETLDGELDALQAVTVIGYAVENNPDQQLSREQHDMLAATEAHSAALKTAASLSEQQNATLADLGQSQQAANVVNALARERYDLFSAATDPEERTRLGREMRELREYTDILVNNDSVAEIASVESAVQSYVANGEDRDLSDKAFTDTKANAFFAKYAQEIIAKATPGEEQRTVVMTDDEVAAAREQLRGLNDSTASRPASEQAQAIDDAQRSVEVARSSELMDEIVKLGKGNTLLYTDTVAVTIGYQFVGDSPKRDFSQLGVPRGLLDKFKSRDWRDELNEVAMFSDVVEGEAHKLIRNELSGQDEPVVRFRYAFQYGNAAIGSAGDELPKYQEFSGGRLGQQVLVGLDLPKSVADQLQEHITDDPKSVRTLVEQLFLQNSGGKVTAESWNEGGKVKHPIRPPYEQLPKDWTMAVITGAEGSRASDYSVQRVATQ